MYRIIVMIIKRCLKAPIKLKRSKNIIKKYYNNGYINIDITYDELLLVNNAMNFILNKNIKNIENYETIPYLNKHLEILLETYK